MNNLGRNDPCHCGSGKKYKKCHLDTDQRSRIGIRQSECDSQPASAWLDVDRLPNLLRKLSEQGSAKDKQGFGELLSKAEPILQYLERRGDIATASAALEPHRSTFEELASDNDRYVALAQVVFAEECFVPLRFTASDVQHAFDHVGYPATMSPDERTVEILRAAILHVAVEERRNVLATSLLLRLPEFVAAGRYLEAWLLQSSAADTAEHHDESNAFLFQMFSYGYDALMADRRTKDESLLRKMGLDPDSLRAMSLDELDSWIQSQQSDKGKIAPVAAFFRENPDRLEESVSNFQALERNSASLLERQDSCCLHLANDEIQPWLRIVGERATQMGLLSGVPDGVTPEERDQQVFDNFSLPLMREMAGSIFSRERILQLVTDLRRYRGERFAAGDQAAAGHAMGAISYLEREDSPGKNSFLVTLCWVSLNAAIKAITAESRHPAESA